MGRVVCFGELLLRLTAPGRELLLQTPRLDVACRRRRGQCRGRPGLARPRDRDGQPGARQCARRGRDRLFAPPRRRHRAASPPAPGGWASISSSPGAGLRASEIVYDREGSSFALAGPDDFDWDALLDGADLLHLSGHHAGARAAHRPRLAIAAAEAAARAGHADLVRRQLPRAAVAALGQRPARDPDASWSARPTSCSAITATSRCCSAASFSGDGEERRREAAEAAFDAFPKLRADRLDRAPRRRCRHATASPRGSTRRDGSAQTEEVRVAGIVDRIGAGDAFAAGVLHGMLHRPRPRLDGPRRPRARLPQAQPARRREPVRAARHRRVHGRRAGRPAMIIGRRSFLIGSGRRCVAAPAFAQRPRDPIVATTLGRVRGTREGGLAVFRGIRYGTAARFQAPRRAAAVARHRSTRSPSARPRRSAATATGRRARIACSSTSGRPRPRSGARGGR